MWTELNDIEFNVLYIQLTHHMFPILPANQGIGRNGRFYSYFVVILYVNSSRLNSFIITMLQDAL